MVAGPLLVWTSPLTGPTVWSWYRVRPAEVAAAEAVQRVSRPTDFVYTLAFGPELLYEADRRGDFMLANGPQLNPAAIGQAAAAGFSYFATGRMDLLDQPAGAPLRACLATYPLVAQGLGWGVWRLR
jgi:hypothetical protein